MTRKVVDTLILDLDNTLFDWFAVWYASFAPVYEAVVRETGRPVAEVEADIRRVHQQHRTSEYSFLLEELQLLDALRATSDVRAHFAEDLAKSRLARDQQLRLYPSVFNGLWDIKKKGTRIVAYTESMSFYSAYRLKRFGLDGVIDVLFSPEDHVVPAGVSVERLRRLPDEFYEMQVTELRHTPPGELKPNPRVLLDIIKTVGATPERCAYVGDSLFKDVAMARDVGVFDIHAKYGESQRRPEYAILQRVSHWTDQDVERERAITAKGHSFDPSAVLKDTFAEIFMYCDFETFPEPKKDDDEKETVKNAIDIWKKCVDVQQHFNDLSMRIRNFAISFIGVLIAAMGFTYQQNLQTDLFGYHFSAGLGLIVAAGFAWCMFFLMDRYWYHVLLKGSVQHAGKIESQFASRIPELSLGKTISEVSQKVKIFGFTLNSERRLSVFYVLGFVLLAVIFFALVLAKSGQPAPLPRPAPAAAQEQVK